jgi:hypothetical protein
MIVVVNGRRNIREIEIVGDVARLVHETSKVGGVWEQGLLGRKNRPLATRECEGVPDHHYAKVNHSTYGNFYESMFTNSS